MKKRVTPEPELTNDQAIDAIYAMFGEKREPLKIQSVGRYGVINPGPKNIPNLLAKLDRKTRRLTDAKSHTPMADVIDSQYTEKEGELFDLLSDWSRFAIIIPDYKSAPAILAHFLAEFGGKASFHNNYDYEAIHQHTTYKDVNLEFQFHTKEYAELKKATDIFYHKYNNVIIEKNSRIADEYNSEQQEMIKYCQIIYNRSDFKQNIYNVQSVIDAYKFRELEAINQEDPNKQTEPKEKLSHFCEYARKAEMVQNELAEYLPQFLTRLNAMEKTALVHEKETL